MDSPRSIRSRSVWLLALVLAAAPLAGQHRAASPGYRYEFPRDHFDHAEFQTEWWYYTGNLHTREGRRFGFELTFFRQAATRDPEPAPSPWTVRDVYVAHLAVSDLDGRAFLYDERANRAGPGIAGIDAATGRIWNGNWSARLEGEHWMLEAVSDRFRVELTLRPSKPPVIHGLDGVSRKAEGTGRASHYVSLTRLATAGTIEIDGTRYDLEGSAWMDHEFFTNQLGPGQRGWDWLGLQLDDGTELMLYRIRRMDGSVDRFSAGTYVDRDGRAMHLEMNAFTMAPGARVWKSPESGAAYPIAWQVTVPSLDLALDLRTSLDSQEIPGRAGFTPSYWEGSVSATGRRGGRPVQGVGYLEMTGYDRPVTFGGPGLRP